MAKNFKKIRLENALIVWINDKPILEVDIFNNSNILQSFIILYLYEKKWKYNNE